jgi:hypothetical protein
MFSTSLTTAVIAGLFACGSITGLPEWSESYGRAMALAGEKRKPVAVFLAPGELVKLTNGKGLPAETLTSLRANYIAVQIDTTTADGKKLAEAFGIPQGVVLSDRSGKQMALKHEGQLTPEQLSEYLARYATTDRAETTEYRTAASVPLHTQYQPQQYHAPQYQTQHYQQPVQYQQPRPVLNAIQNVGGFMMSPFTGGG